MEPHADVLFSFELCKPATSCSGQVSVQTKPVSIQTRATPHVQDNDKQVSIDTKERLRCSIIH